MLCWHIRVRPSNPIEDRKWKVRIGPEVQHFHTDTTSVTREWAQAHPANVSVSTGRSVSTEHLSKF